MKTSSVFLLLVWSTTAFVPVFQTSKMPPGATVLQGTMSKNQDSSITSILLAKHQSLENPADMEQALDKIAYSFRLHVYDPDSGVYGLEAKDSLNYGVETICTTVHLKDDDDSLGIELTEMAHAARNHRGLVLVRAVHGEAKLKPIHIGDTIIGVFVGEHFKESTTALDYDSTVDVLARAKKYARSLGGSTISLELNRLVPRADVKVVVRQEGQEKEEIELEAKASDNLRLLLMQHGLTRQLYDEHAKRLDQPNMHGDCGGEGICGTCLVQVLQGMEHLNQIGPQESSLLRSAPSDWRTACKTVVGADNEMDTTLVIRLRPQKPDADRLHP